MIDTRLADVSDSLLLWAVLAYVVAMVGYAVDLVFSRRAAPAVVAGGATETLPVDWAARERELARRARTWSERCGRAAVAVTAVGWALHVASVVTRGVAADRVPWGNMYEFSSVVCLAAVTAYLVLLRSHPVRRFGVFVLLPVVLYLGLAATLLYAPAAPLVPALNSYWIKIHVTAAVAASGLFLVGFVMNVVYLVKERRPGPGRLPSAERIDDVAVRVIGLAFIVWTFAIIAGAIWAEAAWGRYWGWDPKETWSFVTWVFYAGYLHARATAGWRGRGAAYVGVAGFAALMFCYYGVNLWISGLHSYAGV